VLAARIDRLRAETRALLQTLVVLGKECSWSLLTQVVEQPEEELQRLLTHLQAAEFLYEQPGIPAPKYGCKHVLTQDVAYASLPREQLFQVLWGLRTFYTSRGELQQTHALVEEMLALAQRQHDTALLLEAHFALGYYVWWLGELGAARTWSRAWPSTTPSSTTHWRSSIASRTPGVLPRRFRACPSTTTRF
jgi:hypothetical protein